MGCGGELASLRAAPDPHYHLPIVVCPACGTASVRRPYTGDALRSTVLRAVRTGRELLLRIAGLTAFTLLAIGFTAAISNEVSRLLRSRSPLEIFAPENAAIRQALVRWWADTGSWQSVAAACIWALWGAVCGALFPHWRAGRFIVGFPAVCAAIYASMLLIRAVTLWADGRPARLREILPDGNAAGIFVLVGAIGFALGVALFPLGQRAVTRRRARKGLGSKRLRRIRKRKSRRQ